MSTTNLGTVVKDAFVVPEPLQDLALKVGTTIEGPDQSLTRTDAATARAVMQAAIEHGSRLYPPLSSESWPMCRPLLEWMLRQLPSDGVAPEPKEWAEEETAAIAEDFFASPYGAPLDREDERSLLASVLWFGTGYATGDPFRWSPVTVEMLLADWFPRQDRRRGGVPGEAAGPAACLHPLLPSPARHPGRADRADAVGARSL